MKHTEGTMSNQELFDDLKKVIYNSIEAYAASNNLEITSFYAPDLNIKQGSGSATISLGFSSIVKSKG